MAAMGLRNRRKDVAGRAKRSLLNRWMSVTIAVTTITALTTVTVAAGVAIPPRSGASERSGTSHARLLGSKTLGSKTKEAAGTTTGQPSVEYGHDQEGTSWYPDQSGLTPQLVTGGSFGQLFKTNVQGQTFAQPLVADGVLLVETSQDWIYGMNPRTG